MNNVVNKVAEDVYDKGYCDGVTDAIKIIIVKFPVNKEEIKNLLDR